MTPYYQKLNIKCKKVRHWPYPYSAGLAISNDIEFMGFDVFETLMEFLNTSKQTKLGTGLGLPMSSSFFFFSAHAYNFSYFKGSSPDSSKSRVAGRMNEYIQSGWLDNIHAFGDFDFVGGFRRQHAIRALESLDVLNTKIKIYTNHGSADNIQNVGKDAEYHSGDVSGHPAFCMDLIRNAGVKYFWTDSLTTKREDRFSLKHVKETIKKRVLKVGQNDTKADNSFFISAPMNDGAIEKGFLRFRSTGGNAPNLASFMSQLNQIEWETLYANKGGMVVYQHLGVLDRVAGKCIPLDIDTLLREQSLLDPFYFLHTQQQRGQLWVATLKEFLSYAEMVESITIQEQDNDVFVIQSDKDLVPEELAGLTIYVDTKRPFKIYYRDKELKVNTNSGDHRESSSVSIPFVENNDIW